MEKEQSPIILWIRRDLRLSDHPALCAAVASGRPVIPVFILDHLTDALGSAPKWRLEAGLGVFERSLRQLGSRLILRRGEALSVLRQLVDETGACAVYWSRAYDADSIVRDTHIKATLNSQGVRAQSFSGHLVFEPWTVATKAGQPFRVFTPMWRAVQARDVAAPEKAPSAVPAPANWPQSDKLEAWQMGAAMNRGAEVIAPFVRPGEGAAFDALHDFLARVAEYSSHRDRLDLNGTSVLSEDLSLGEISPRSVWHAVQRAAMNGVSGTDAFLRQLVWREFAYHLMYHTPRLLTGNWKTDWDAFAWNTDANRPEVIAWTQARTGVPAVHAGLRLMYVTGRMPNRPRMLVASYLTKHLLTPCRIGMDWFADCLIDWDPAANAMGWQWVAGSGPDAAPFFRIFNPQTQQEKFDPKAAYLHAWIAEGQSNPPATALSYFDAVPRSWAIKPDDEYPDPVVELAAGRTRALAAYHGPKTR